ncbi:MAG: hypothetical protein ACK53X_05955 [Holosporales bacterium]|jgi:hypothetical protein
MSLENGLGDMMSPLDAIHSTPPNVWLRGLYGFRPEVWGMLGFTKKSDLDSFINRSKPGALVVIYGTVKAPKEERGKVLGIQQCSHFIRSAQELISPEEWKRKKENPDSADRWEHAVQVVRAWRITPETQPRVADFAFETYTPGRGQIIGSKGRPLTSKEAQQILTLDLQEVDVFGADKILSATIAPATDMLNPSKAGPVSQNSFTTREAESEKYLYILQLVGDESAFLGEDSKQRIIVKAGFSKSPATRCRDHNNAIPSGAYKWKILYSGHKENTEPYPNSKIAKIGEQKLQRVLMTQKGKSLGNEFFLATERLVEHAWIEANKAAKAYMNEL